MPRDCDSCGKELVPVHIYQKRKDDEPNYKNALKIKFDGGYAEYIDEHIEPFLVCGECAAHIIKILPPVFLQRIGPSLNIKQYIAIEDA